METHPSDEGQEGNTADTPTPEPHSEIDQSLQEEGVNQVTPTTTSSSAPLSSTQPPEAQDQGEAGGTGENTTEATPELQNHPEVVGKEVEEEEAEEEEVAAVVVAPTPSKGRGRGAGKKRSGRAPRKR